MGYFSRIHCIATRRFKDKMGDPPQFQGRIIFMSMFNDIIWRSENNERECIANVTLVTFFAKRFPARRWSFLGLGSEKKWYSTFNERPRREWDRVAELLMDQIQRKRIPSFPSHESIVSRNAQKQKRRKNIEHSCADGNTIAQLFLLINSGRPMLTG